MLLPTLQNPARLTVGRGFPARWPTTLGGGAADGNPFYLINFLLFFLLILSYSFSFSPFFFDFKILNPNHKKNPRSIKYKLKGKLPIFYGNSLICVRFWMGGFCIDVGFVLDFIVAATSSVVIASSLYSARIDSGFVENLLKICSLGRRISSVIAGLIRLRIGLGWRKKENAHCVVFWMMTIFLDFYQTIIIRKKN